MREDLLHIIALTKVKGIGSILAKQLIAYCGNAESVFKSKANVLAKIPQVGEIKARLIVNAKPWEEAENEIKFIESKGINPLFYLDEDYPRRLIHYDDSPILLYYSGNSDLNAHRTVGIVGTRTPSTYGQIMCEKIVEGLKQYQASIVSGMAYGIDSVAHRKSVEMSIPTIGVLGHGLDRLYPQSNINLSQKMLDNGGLLTEFPSGTNPDRENFPMRNRIIAALSDAVVVVESKIRGGSIITAEFANAYNKDVFAVPGKIDDVKSAGCNRLIKSHKAALIESAEDIGYVMRWEKQDNQQVQGQLFLDLSPKEKSIVDLLRQKKEINIDKLHHLLEIPISELSGILLNMEFNGLIRTLPGKKYILI